MPEQLGVMVGDVRVTRVSLHNAKFVNENGIGPGSILLIRRSGDVIPYVDKIIKPMKPARPDVKEVGEYQLDKNGTNYVLSKPADSEAFRLQRILKFFNTLDVDFMRIGTITKLYGMGFTNIKAIINATPEKLIRGGLTAATANKLHGAIQGVLDAGVPLITLMDASGTFPHGMGKTRFENIAEAYDLEALLYMSADEQEKALLKLPGFASTTVGSFIKGAPKFIKWLGIVGITPAKPKRKVKVKLKSNSLNGMGVTWTGYRNKDEEQVVTENGGIVVPFGSKTQVLLVSPSGKASSKEDKAREKNIPVLMWDKFTRKYGVS